jgi:transposase
MAWAYPAGRRRAVVADMRRGLSARAAAALRGVSASSAARWRRIEAQTGSLEPKTGCGRGRRALAGQRDWLRAEVAARPGVTLAALQAGLRARGVSVSRDTVWRMLRELGLGVGERATGTTRERP